MKKLKYIFIALAVIVLCIGGYIVYELKFKSYDTADPEVDALIEETYNVELPDGTVIVVDKEGNIVENKTSESQNNGVTTASAQTSSTNVNSDSTQDDEEGTETGTTNNGNGSSNSNSGQTGTSASSKSSSNTGTTGSNSNANPNTNTNTGGSNKPAEKVTVASIKSKYEGTFKSLENQSRARINSLISQAANEYSTKKSNGESISYGYFYKKYMGAANGIESATDSTVNVVVGLVEKDLQKNGFDKSYAQSFKEDYNAMKESLRSEMMDKALSFR
ncbi:hypothetical protein [Solibacillus sp. NPDC093137]|uniref:hypothetical protein n=1 Tax=Solibacillus sp. NPDC093137 TaxID=3390678 RepID=UPI003D00655F